MGNLELRVWGFGFRAQGSFVRVGGSKLRVEGSGRAGEAGRDEDASILLLQASCALEHPCDEGADHETKKAVRREREQQRPPFQEPVRAQASAEHGEEKRREANEGVHLAPQ